MAPYSSSAVGMPRFGARDKANRRAHLQKNLELRSGFDYYIKENFGHKKKRDPEKKTQWNAPTVIGLLPSLDNYSSLGEKEEAKRKAKKEAQEAEEAERRTRAEAEIKSVHSILVVPASRQSSGRESARPKSVRWSDQRGSVIEPSLFHTQSNPEESSPSLPMMKSDLSVISLDSIPAQTPSSWEESVKYPKVSKRQKKLQPPSFASMLEKKEQIKAEKASRNEKNKSWVAEYVGEWGFESPNVTSADSHVGGAGTPFNLQQRFSSCSSSDPKEANLEAEEKGTQPISEIYSLKSEINHLQLLMQKAKQSENAVKLPSMGLRKVLRTVEKGTPYTRQERPMRANKYFVARMPPEAEEDTRPMSRSERERNRWTREEAPSRSGRTAVVV